MVSRIAEKAVKPINQAFIQITRTNSTQWSENVHIVYTVCCSTPTQITILSPTFTR